MVNLYHKHSLVLHSSLIERARYLPLPAQGPQKTAHTQQHVNMELESIRFDSLKELKKWNSTPRGPLDAFLIPRVALSRRHSTDSHRVMVVHDYKNGYQQGEDGSPMGSFPHRNGRHYMLQFPSLVDIFVYFSHHRVTVPPVPWVNSLHRLGIPVLGTLIFEDDELDDLLERDGDTFVFVDILMNLTRNYRFDGWLINVETALQHSAPEELLSFVSSLRSALKCTIPHSQVIWYDSFVTEKNRIWYQNGVNEHNYDHFENTDLFLTNYWWDESSLKSNVKNIGSLGLRKLFVGVDVWGRGDTVGKGGLDIGTSLDSLRVYQSNVGLFAPAWTYEKNIDDFDANDKQFWIGGSTEEFPMGGVSMYVSERSAPCFVYGRSVGFFTTFSQGQGHFFNVCGHKVYNRHWVEKSIQSSTPMHLNRLIVNYTDAFIGGSCLEVHYTLEHTSFNLFKLHMEVTSDVVISIGYKQLEFTQDQISQLEVSYYIERRYKSVTKVKSGKVALPLRNITTWKEITTKFPLPKLGPHEHCIISDISIRLVEYQAHLSQSWVLLPQNRQRLLLGYMVITDADNDDTLPVTRLKKKDMEDKQVLCTWPQYENVHCWLVYVNTMFVRVSNSPHAFGARGDKIRVDTLTRFGIVLRGIDLFV